MSFSGKWLCFFTLIVYLKAYGICVANENLHQTTLSSSAVNQNDRTFPYKEFAILDCANDCGLFRTLASLTGLLCLYERGLYKGVKVDFGLNGLYYDSKHGPNWWEYYFEPVQIGHTDNTLGYRTINGPPDIDCAMLTEFVLTRKDVYELIKKYIKIKPRIQAKISKFVRNHFKGNIVIGVHYRGTDKWSEAPIADYQIMATYINHVINHFNQPNVKVFIATDEQAFIDYIKELFPSKIVFYEEAIRSTSNQPLHKSNSNPYKSGEDAIMDCLLLSNCDVLIKTSSNLSLFASYFNPEMHVIHVTSRPGKTPLQ